MRVLFQVKGRTPLVMHNIRLADPEDEFTRAIAKINDKKKNKTDEDQHEIARLEWFGGIYHDPDVGIHVPSTWVVASLENAAKITRRGTQLLRGLAMTTDRIALEYDGPKKLTELYERPEFRLRKIVGVQRNRVVRVRPIFRQWGLLFDAELMTDVMDLDDLKGIAAQAGRSAGMGDARKLGYGRYDVEVEE